MRKHIAPRRGLLGPRHAGHTLATDHLGALSLPVGDDGVIIGDDAEGRPQMIGFHRPAPYDVLLIGGLWTAQVLALRAAATGARVAVETGRTQAWTTLAQAAGATRVRLAPRRGAGPSDRRGRGQPGGGGTRLRHASAPRTGGVLAVAVGADIAALSEPGGAPVDAGGDARGHPEGLPAEAEQIGRILGLARTESEALPTLADGVTLWVSGRDRHWVMTSATDVETGLLGTARRMD